MTKTRINFLANGSQATGYLALPARPNGRGLLVLHAWWGLTPFFQTLCDRLADEGFAAFAPDLFHGKTADTVETAYQLEQERDFGATRATAQAALAFFLQHPAVAGKKIGALGFSLGAIFALLLHENNQDAFGAITLFYGGSEMDLSRLDIPLLCHFAEIDEFEPLETVQNMAVRNGDIHIYPGTRHWFCESDRPEYNEEAAALAWQRSIAFFNEKLSSLNPGEWT